MNLKRNKIKLIIAVLTVSVMFSATGVYASDLLSLGSVAEMAGQIQHDTEVIEREVARAEYATTAAVFTETHTTAAELDALPEDQRVVKIGKMCQENYTKTGILASISAAQCILESGYLTTDLAVNANNCFGMKTTLSDNAWPDSTWDGTSTYTKDTWEEYDGKAVTVTADFRKYDCIEKSIDDHAAYLLGATTGDGSLRYGGINEQTDYTAAITMIKEGGYATDSQYVSKICNIIERYDLTRFDVKIKGTFVTPTPAPDEKRTYDDGCFRVRMEWSNEKSQIGIFSDQEAAKKVCTDGYSVYDEKGNMVYSTEGVG